MTNNKKTNTKKPAGIEYPKYKELQDKLTAAEAKSNDYWNEMLRAKADLENMQRRAEKDVANAHKYGIKNFALELLPVIDSMELGFSNCAEGDDTTKSIRHGMQLTIELFLKTMKRFGIEQIDPLGKDFDPELHEAMTMKEDTSVKPNTVIEVMQKGYLLNDRLIRPALVIVAKSA